MPKKELYYKRKKAGLCVNCGVDALPLHARCSNCLHKAVRYQADYASNKRERLAMVARDNRARHKANGECPKCGVPLDEDMDEGRVNCVNCRDRDKRPGMRMFGKLIAWWRLL